MKLSNFQIDVATPTDLNNDIPNSIVPPCLLIACPIACLGWSLRSYSTFHSLMLQGLFFPFYICT
jgi:hypothetical protein